jgi:hypothetical protein
MEGSSLVLVRAGVTRGFGVGRGQGIPQEEPDHIGLLRQSVSIAPTSASATVAPLTLASP